MITAVAFCPHPPVLVPELARDAAPELDELRTACRAAITRIAVPGRRLAVVGAGPESRRYPAEARGTFAGYGVPVEVSLGRDAVGSMELPLSLTVGAWLLRDAIGPNSGAVGYSVTPGWLGTPIEREWFAFAHGPEQVAVVVMGDGSARRSIAAPGYLDERAAEYDAWIAEALRLGRPDRLHHTGQAHDLLVAGEWVWDDIAAMTEGPSWDAELLYDAAPYGVGYFVAVWT